MSKVIQVLEKMARDASLLNEENITTMLTDADITNNQQQAIVARDINKLADSLSDLTKIKYVIPLIAADDDEPKESEMRNETNSQLAYN
ncbi:hypothetical protein [Colwellia sp. Bg11-28]|uniref:hypothetical protein n=1 Tax=Colwellia sp. Bg11-28 TaxID=2058305 RepID=UPI0012FF01E7|nr:hypothetical protein [Colwellia sp. Bg11-28]